MKKPVAPIRTTTKLHASPDMFAIANDATHLASQRKAQFCSLRQTVVLGIDEILAMSRVDRLILIKGFDRTALAGDRVFALSFTADERRLINEARRLVATQSLTSFTIEETIKLALLAVLRSK